MDYYIPSSGNVILSSEGVYYILREFGLGGGIGSSLLRFRLVPLNELSGLLALANLSAPEPDDWLLSFPPHSEPLLVNLFILQTTTARSLIIGILNPHGTLLINTTIQLTYSISGTSTFHRRS